MAFSVVAGLGATLGAAAMSVVNAVVGKREKNTNEQTVYEPDKVRVAEIEAESKERLAKIDIERGEAYKQAQLELLQFRTESQMALEEAKVRNLDEIIKIIISIQAEMDEITLRRLDIIEKGANSVVMEMEEYYHSMANQIQSENDDYTENRLPVLLEQLEKYKPGTAAYSIYEKQIISANERRIDTLREQLSALVHRQDLIITGIENTKRETLAGTNMLTSALMQTAQMQISRTAEEMRSLENKNSEISLLTDDCDIEQ